MSEFRDLLLAELGNVGLSDSLSEEQIAKLEGHYLLLTAWNRKLNLTSIRTVGDLVRRHYCECLYFAALLSKESRTTSGTVIDAGSGAGFPGVPIAVLLPEWHVYLVEADQRKAVFLREACRKLSNTSVLGERLEQVRITGDWMVSRAVRPPDILKEFPRLAPSIGLLLGPGGASNAREDHRMTWLPDIPLPWGEKTVALFGRLRD